MGKAYSNILKIALFATGLAGIVAEYVLATLATYFLGDSVVQWTMVLSVMLFSMGLGSRLARAIKKHLLATFVTIEFLLSLLTSFSALATYTLHGVSVYTGLAIYGLAVAVGLLIGLEIPLVTRLNSKFEQLSINISSVMEKDYYGSLAGGVFFAFVGVPLLGLTYTPFVLGTINFMVALLLLWRLRGLLPRRQARGLALAGTATFGLLLTGLLLAEPIIQFGEQSFYKDKVVYVEQSRYQKLVITQWKQDHWLYINGNQQLSTLDEHLYHEPLVHPAMLLTPQPRHVLVLGGGDGCAARELLKHSQVDSITLVDLDPAMTRLARTHPVLTTLNQGSLESPKVRIVNQDAFLYLQQTRHYYDLVIIDLPDPKTVELSKLYSHEFYNLCYRQLRPGGTLVTQAGSPYLATRAFQCVNLTLQAAGFSTLPLHNHVVTLGEWGWIIAKKEGSTQSIKQQLLAATLPPIPLAWLNQEALGLITSFGQPLFEDEAPQVNTIRQPVLYQYYLKGNWDLY